MSQRHHLSGPTLLALCAAYLLSAVASEIAGTAATFSENGFGFSITESLSFIVSMATIALVVVAVRGRSAWLALLTAQAAMLVGAATILIDANRFISQLSLSVVLIGAKAVAAVLLVVAWRSEAKVTAVMAGVFVLPEVLGNTLWFELFRTESMFARTPLTVVTLFLVLAGLLATAAVQSGEPVVLQITEGGLERNVVIGGTVALAGMATLAAQTDPYGGGPATGVALLAFLIGSVIMGVTQQNRKTNAPAIHLDPALLIFCGLSVALATWVRFGSDFLPNGSTFNTNSIAFDFDDFFGWTRGVSLFLVLTTVPLVALFARGGRRLLSAGAAAIATAGLVWVFFVLDDLELDQTNYALFTVLIEWGGFIVLGGSIAFAIRRTTQASIEFGVIFFLAVVPLIARIARPFPFDFIGEDLITSGFNDTGDLRLFTLTTVIALAWIAVWWALRPDKAGQALEADHELASADIGSAGPSVVDSEVSP